MNYTAKRVTKGSKTEILVLDESGNVTARAGGNRAVRANAVVLSMWESRNSKLPRMEVELRADVDAAEKLAASYRTVRTIRSRHSYTTQSTAAVFAAAILIEEAGQ